MPVLKLTQNFVSNELLCPEGKNRIEYCDSDVPGLYVLVGSQEKVSTYYLRYKDANKKTCHEKLGRTTEIDLVEARKRARTMKAQISLGSDPRGEEKARQAVITFGEFFENHYLPYVKPRKRSWKRDEELYRLRIKDAFGTTRLNLVDRKRIVLFHSALKAEGLAGATCDHHVKLLKHAFNLAIDWGMMEDNPARRVPLFNEDNKVEHYLNEEELARLLTVLRTDSNRPICLIALFLISVGCRLNEALSAKWSDIDLATRSFIVRASNAKSKRMRAVPLNDSAIEVLSQLDTKDNFEYLFINKKTKQPYTTIMKVWSRLRNDAKLPHLRLHDLRHQYASFLINSGRTLYEVAKILGHADNSLATTARYSHLSTKSLQDAANSASVMLKGAAKLPQVPPQ